MFPKGIKLNLIKALSASTHADIDKYIFHPSCPAFLFQARQAPEQGFLKASKRLSDT